jgi:hypothetical protein
MDLSEPEADLGKVLEDIVFRKEFFTVFQIFEQLIKIASFSILHDNTEFIFGGVINFLEADDVIIPYHIMELRFKEGLFFFFGFKVSDVDTFHDIKFVIFLCAFDEVDFAHGALTEDFYFFVLFLLVFGGAVDGRDA